MKRIQQSEHLFRANRSRLLATNTAKHWCWGWLARGVWATV